MAKTIQQTNNGKAALKGYSCNIRLYSYNFNELIEGKLLKPANTLGYMVTWLHGLRGS